MIIKEKISGVCVVYLIKFMKFCPDILTTIMPLSKAIFAISTNTNGSKTQIHFINSPSITAF